MASLCVYRFFTSKEMILSFQFNSIFSIISLAASVFVAMFEPPIVSKNLAGVFFQFFRITTGERDDKRQLSNLFIYYSQCQKSCPG